MRGNVEMVKWIGKFSLLLKRLRDAWMDMLPVSTMSEERRQNQYLADVTQLNEERQRKMLLPWIRTHKRPETIGTPYR